MSNFCPNCGEDITEKVKFCPKCGADISSFNLKSHDTPITENREIVERNENKKIDTKYSITDLVVYGVIIVLIIILLPLLFAFTYGMAGNVPSSQPKNNVFTNYFVPTPTESLTQRNIRIAKEIVATYHSTHTYSLNDFYVCGDMASDVWDMLKTQGINSKINVGNINKDITEIKDADHAWVIAEVAPNSYLALEATGGYSVDITENPRYYKGWSFYNPKQLKNYMQLSKQRNDAVEKYNAAVSDYNNFLAQYNKANFLTQLILNGQLDDKKLILNQRTQDLNQITQQINSLLSSL